MNTVAEIWDKALNDFADLPAVRWLIRKDIAEKSYKEDWKDFDNKDAKVHGGIALLAGGLGLGIAGSAVAIYAFLKENKVSQQYDTYLNHISEESGDNPTPTAFNFDVGPGSVAFGMTF